MMIMMGASSMSRYEYGKENIHVIFGLKDPFDCNRQGQKKERKGKEEKDDGLGSS